MIKTQFLLLSSILKSRLDEVCPNVFIALRNMLNCRDSVASAERSSENWSWSKPLKRNIRGLAPLTVRTPNQRKWLKPNCLCYRCPYRFDQRSASLVISDRGILCFDFHIRHIHLMQFPLT